MLTASALPLERYLARLLFRSELGQAEQQAILSLPHETVRLRAGQRVTTCGVPSRCVHIVANGLLASIDDVRNGGRQITALHIPGDMADLGSFLFGAATSSIEALADSSLIAIRQHELRSLLTKSPMIGAAFARDIAIDGVIAAKWMVNIGRRSARSRLAHFFCELACREEQAGRLFSLSYELPMTQEHLGSATAMTAVHLNRSLMSLRADGIVEMRSRVVEVLDWEAMMGIGEFDRTYLHGGMSPKNTAA